MIYAHIAENESWKEIRPRPFFLEASGLKNPGQKRSNKIFKASQKNKDALSRIASKNRFYDIRVCAPQRFCQLTDGRGEGLVADLTLKVPAGAGLAEDRPHRLFREHHGDRQARPGVLHGELPLRDEPRQRADAVAGEEESPEPRKPRSRGTLNFISFSLSPYLKSSGRP